MFEFINSCPLCKQPLNDGRETKQFGDPGCPFTGHAECVDANESVGAMGAEGGGK